MRTWIWIRLTGFGTEKLAGGVRGGGKRNGQDTTQSNHVNVGKVMPSRALISPREVNGAPSEAVVALVGCSKVNMGHIKNL